jgi:bifunctional non-homologous end joining protein LigD
LLNFVDQAEVARLIASPDWWAQPKYDGKRLLVKKAGVNLTAINRRGLSVGAPQPILDSVAAVAGDCLVDGEAVGETLFAFDLIDAPALPYSARLARLEALGLSGAVVVVETARTTAEKQAMYDSLQAAGGEGIVYKRHHAPYTAGRPNSGGSQVKHKFYAAVSVLVTKINNQRSVSLAMLDGGKQVAVGKVTIPANHDIPPVGAVVEVRYLYAYKGGNLYQPTYLGERDDVEADDISALKYKVEE